MNFLTIILMIASFFLVSCSRQGVTPANIELTTAFFQSDLGNKGGGGVYLYGFGPGGQRFGKVMNGTSFSESLPNGIWSFFAVAWEATAGVPNLSGVTRCASLKQMTLNGSEVNLNMTLTKPNCDSADFTNNVPMNNSLTSMTTYLSGVIPQDETNVGDVATNSGSGSGAGSGSLDSISIGSSGGATGGGQNFEVSQRFPIFKLEVCNTFPQNLSAIIPGCNYDTSTFAKLTAPKNKGYFSSVKVMLGSFTKSSSSDSAIFDEDEDGIESVCLEIDPNGSGSPLFPGPAEMLNIPFGHTSAPFPFRIRGYYGSANCDDSDLNSKTINLLGGRLENSSEAKGNLTANVSSPYPVTTSVGKIYLRTPDADVCTGERLITTTSAVDPVYSGGTGHPGRPFLICTKEQFNSIQNNLWVNATTATSFKVMRHIDFSFSTFVPIGEDVNSSPDGIVNPDGTYAVSFSGSFDGGGYELKNIFLRKESTGSPGYSMLGLIRNIFNGKVFNLKISDSSIECRPQSSSTCDQVGLIAGEALNSIIYKVYVKGHLVGSSNVGGVVGRLSGNSNITKAFAHVSIDGDCPSEICLNVGGLVGEVFAASGSSITITESASKAFINADNTNHVGGLVGSSIINSGIIGIKTSLSHGYVRGKQSVGGLVGHNNGETSLLHDSYSFATVMASDPGNTPARAGGLVGWSAGGDIQRSFHSVGRVVGNPDVASNSLWGDGSTGTCVNSFGRSSSSIEIGNCSAVSTISLLDDSLHGALGVDSEGSTNPNNSVSNKFIKNNSDIGYDYPQLKWERTLFGDTGFVIPFLERPCLGQFDQAMLGSGTPLDPYQICSIDHLNPISKDHYYKLMRDLDFFGVPRTASDLLGFLDGNNKTIRNVSLLDMGGFWHDISGSVENLNFENLSLSHNQVPGGGEVVGILSASNSGTIKNIRISDSVLSLNGSLIGGTNPYNLKVGGLVGKNEIAGVIENVESRPVINFAPRQLNSSGTVEWLVGGIAGDNGGSILAASSEIRIKSIDNTALDLPFASHSLFVGGIVGRNIGSINESAGTLSLHIDNSNFNDADIGKYYFGGIAGTSSGTIANSMGVNHEINLTLTTSPTSAVGGIVGYLNSNGTVQHSYATFDIQNGNDGINRIGGLIGDLAWDNENDMTVGNSNLPILTTNFCTLKDFDPSINEIAGYNGNCFDSSQAETSPQTLADGTIIPYTGKTFSGWNIIQDQFNRISTAIWLMRPNELPKLRKLQPWFDDI
jgi:hypothetical protein